MTARITALILSLCIGLPMCWCCIGSAPREEVAGCCAKRQHAASEQQPAQSQGQNCPCAKHEDMRDVAVTFVKAPAPVLKLLADPAWAMGLPESLTPSVYDIKESRHDHGPPLPVQAAPLYARHCALLI